YLFFVCMLRPHLRSTLFPYTTLFRSKQLLAGRPQNHLHGKFRLDPHHGQVEMGVVMAKQCRQGIELAAMGEVGTDMARPLEPERSEEHTSELQSRENLVCRLLLEKKK